MTDNTANIRWSILFAGTVQGVGFRYRTQGLARRYPEIAGYVRNLTDGRVELVIEGPPAALARLLTEIEADMAGYIQDRHRTESPATGEFTSFAIRH